VCARIGLDQCELLVTAMCVLQGQLTMLKTVAKYMPLKATMRQTDIPGLSSGDITFSGVVSSEDYRSIIANAKVFSYCRCNPKLSQIYSGSQGRILRGLLQS